MVHTLMPKPKTHIQDNWRIVDFFSLHPDSLHMFTLCFDDARFPQDYLHMDIGLLSSMFSAQTLLHLKSSDSKTANLDLPLFTTLGINENNNRKSHWKILLWNLSEWNKALSHLQKIQLLTQPDEAQPPCSENNLWENTKQPTANQLHHLTVALLLLGNSTSAKRNPESLIQILSREMEVHNKDEVLGNKFVNTIQFLEYNF
ncbi:hypothetical protein Nepgr_019551 [Nepenthes gracilis]|uniref:catalase n=1 Tax=Nepenthes gracilis TaxID=150966 RepID=A0AAD3SV94_NEPGR|nr:hypothetical protein Nepgr_019551 [Nepenthes gracilis]